jgi:hypothetical protein
MKTFISVVFFWHCNTLGSRAELTRRLQGSLTLWCTYKNLGFCIVHLPLGGGLQHCIHHRSRSMHSVTSTTSATSDFPARNPTGDSNPKGGWLISVYVMAISDHLGHSWNHLIFFFHLCWRRHREPRNLLVWCLPDVYLCSASLIVECSASSHLSLLDIRSVSLPLLYSCCIIGPWDLISGLFWHFSQNPVLIKSQSEDMPMVFAFV